LQHPGSDESIWKQRALRDREAGLKSAMTAGNLALRIGDVRFAIDDIERRAAAGEGVWAQADLNRIGMSGHSFGAGTTLALSGHRAPALAGQSGLDPRIVAAIGLSPMARQKSQLSRQFGDIRIPFFSVTGTEDNAVLGDNAVWQDRTLAFENMPSGGKYLLVIDGADHMVLGGRAMGRRKSSDHDNSVAATLKAATLAFWMAHLNGDKAAREWLEAPSGFAKSLPEADRFKWK
jgi:predicted dienelactone hydrolase